MTYFHFSEYNLENPIIKAASDLGFETPTPVQQEVIPAVLNGRDIIAKSETGSGKTAAYGIPICNEIKVEATNPLALIITPTRELAVQVKEDITSIGRYKKIRCENIFGKQPMQMQRRVLKQRVHVVVGTPGRLLDHIQQGTLVLSDIKYLVLDEADEMLSMGFVEQVDEILKRVPQSRTTMLFSATISPELRALSEKYMKNPLLIDSNPGQLMVANIDQSILQIEEKRKFDVLIRVLMVENPDSCLLFCRTQERTADLANRLRQQGILCRELHGGMMQQDRLDTMKDFKRAAFRFLTATDVAARGIDVESVSLIINYDIPLEKEKYVHRIGRTGRAGSFGKAISFVAPYEDKFLKEIEAYIMAEIPRVVPPSVEEMEHCKEAFIVKNKQKPIIKEEKSARMDEKITKLYIGGGRKNKIRPGDIVGAISNIDGVKADEIGIIDILDYVSYVEIMNGKGDMVLNALQKERIKGRQLRVEKADK